MRNRIALFMLVASLILSACQLFEKQDAALKTEINKAFEFTPPPSSNVTVKLLDKPIDRTKNVLVSVRFDGEQVKGPFHAIMVSDEKLVLRDDGKRGDEKAGDGIFSVAIAENLDLLSQEIEDARRKRAGFLKEQRPLIEWVNRVGTPVSEKLIDFDAVQIDFKRGFQFDPKQLLLLPVTSAVVDKSLMITNLSVVEDPSRTFNPCTNAGNPNGAWTFKMLMTNMANTAVTGISPEDFVRTWLSRWMTTQTGPGVNGDNIPDRSILSTVVEPWLQASNPGVTLPALTLANWTSIPIDLNKAPFKLLAIVNRLDLRGNSGYSISNAGEGRFVFGVINSSNCNPLTGPGKFTVIFEYGIPKKTCASLKAYAQEWLNLSTMTTGSPAYNAALQAITDQFTAAGAGGTKPNGSAINQIRTNEFAIGSPWELREFVVDGNTHLLISTTVKQEPAKIFNRLANPPASATNLQRLADYVNTNTSAILSNTNTVPLTVSGVNFLGAKAHTETPGHFWDAAIAGPAMITNDDARFQFSLNTCSGCHGGEGRTSVGDLLNPGGAPHNPFLHITPQPFGVETTLSAFLTGDPSEADGLFKITDPAGRPAGSPTIRGFNDLARRATDLEKLAQKSCKIKTLDLAFALSFQPLNMTH